jgi:hypothetical protein
MQHVPIARQRLVRSITCSLLAALLLVGLSAMGAGHQARAGSPPNRLDNNGGDVIAHPNIHNLYFSGSWDSDNPAALSSSAINTFTTQLVGSNYFAKAGQYGVGSASFEGSDGRSILCPVPSIAGVTDFFAILAWVQCETLIGPDPFIRPTATGIPIPDDNSLYVVYIPTGTQINDIAFHTCDSFGAYHFMTSNLEWTFPTFHGFPLPPVPLPQRVAFAVVPAECAHGSLDSLTELATHEIIEAATDPVILTGWIDNSQIGFNADILKKGEAADICEQGVGAVPTPPVELTNGLMVAPYWSNADGKCEPITRRVNLNETGLPGTVPHTATFDGGTVTLPFATVIDDGSSHSYSFPTPVNDPNPGIRYVTTTAPGTIDGSMDVSVTATYTTQYFLTVQAVPPAAAAGDVSLTPSQWVAAGNTVNLTTDALIDLGGGNRYRFGNWSGDASGTSPATTVLMTGPKTATANYVLQHLLTVNTTGLGANNATITNGTTILGTANDTAPLVVWVDDGPLALGASANVNGADGIQYFFQGFTPPAPSALTAPFTTTAVYKTMAQLIDDALASGGITGPGASGLATSFKHQFAAVQEDFHQNAYDVALDDLTSFISHVQAQCCTPQSGKHLTPSTAQTFQLDALLVYHNALCLALANGQIDAAMAAMDYTYYSTLVASLGGTVLPPC